MHKKTKKDNHKTTQKTELDKSLYIHIIHTLQLLKSEIDLYKDIERYLRHIIELNISTQAHTQQIALLWGKIKNDSEWDSELPKKNCQNRKHMSYILNDAREPHTEKGSWVV